MTGSRAAVARGGAAGGARAWILCFGLLGSFSALLVIYRPLLNQRQAPVALTLLMVVLLGSVMGGRALGVALALGGFLVIDYHFQLPYGQLAVRDPADWLVLITFVITADVASRLLARAQRESEEARRRADEVQRLALERERLAAELESAEIRREADRLREFVVATVSHDLRTPLTTIKVLAHERAIAGDRGAAIIEEQADRLTRIVTDLLDLSRARAGALPLEPEINTAEDVIGATLRQARGVLRERVIEQRLRTSGGALVGLFDFVATLRILGNLLENAAKYSPEGTPIVLDVVRENDSLAFSVRDRGPGVSENERERIFAPFHRASGSAPDVGGAGLGLAVARALAEAQGGSLALASNEGGGSVFTLRVPASHDATAMELIAEGAMDRGGGENC